MTATVIGCVWGAHHTLVERLGDTAPSYGWCEQQWNDGLRRKAPGDRAIPTWLVQELWARWRAEAAAERAERIRTGEIAGDTHQLALSLWGVG